MATFNYQEYLASREWAKLRKAVRERSNNTCERCFVGPQDAVHHKTYARVGHELLEDLQAICKPCHDFLSAESDVDPLVKVKAKIVPPKPIVNSANFYLCEPYVNNPLNFIDRKAFSNIETPKPGLYEVVLAEVLDLGPRWMHFLDFGTPVPTCLFRYQFYDLFDPFPLQILEVFPLCETPITGNLRILERMSQIDSQSRPLAKLRSFDASLLEEYEFGLELIPGKSDMREWQDGNFIRVSRCTFRSSDQPDIPILPLTLQDRTKMMDLVERGFPQ